MSRERDARRANHELYESGTEVAAYLRHPYHALRLQIARRLLADHLAGPRPTVLELGGATLRERFFTVVWRFGAGRELHSRLLARLAPTLGGSLICAAVRDH